MYIIYEPQGKAFEYSPLAANLYTGCEHGCIGYCYGPATLWMKKNPDKFFKSPQPRADVIAKLEKDARKIAGDPRPILLCFTCDPYQPIEKDYKITREAIRILHENELKVRILTKAGELARRDFDLLSTRPDLSEFGATLIFTTHNRGLELKTAPEPKRIKNLEIAHSKGIPTWVSLEPVFFPEESLDLIRMTQHCVDRYAVGKLNHRKPIVDFDLVKFREDAIELLESLGKEYYIKKDLAEAR
jgi:DNA repair photolyase